MLMRLKSPHGKLGFSPCRSSESKMLLLGTRIVVIAGTLGFLLWDLLAYLRGGVSATESTFIITMAKKYPSIPFALGILMGHLFF
jgi:hypothetical protein